MKCAQARLLIGADPNGAPPEGLDEHLQGCEECARFRGEMRALETHIHRALQQPPELARSGTRAAAAWRQWALAASVVLASALLAGVWLLRPSDTLAHELTLHVQAEPDSWLSAEHFDAQDINGALRGEGVTLQLTSDRVVYAHSCFFRGHYVPHLVLQTSQGPATVIVLRHEQVKSRRSFSEDGMQGIIVPAPQGALAVLVKRGSNLQLLAQQMQQDVRWLPDAH